jgi:CRISPR/Cas system endoribonuclease Cas6 (RAMP superfamily)
VDSLIALAPHMQTFSGLILLIGSIIYIYHTKVIVKIDEKVNDKLSEKDFEKFESNLKDSLKESFNGIKDELKQFREEINEESGKWEKIAIESLRIGRK